MQITSPVTQKILHNYRNRFRRLIRRHAELTVELNATKVDSLRDQLKIRLTSLALRKGEIILLLNL